MQLKTRYVLILIISLTKDVLCQNKSDSDSLFIIGQYELAAYEFERDIFESKDQSFRDNCFYKKALCYKNLNNYELEILNLNRISLINQTDTFLFKCIFEKSLALYKTSNFRGSLNELNTLEFYNIGDSLKKETYFLYALDYIELENIESSKEYLTKYLNRNEQFDNKQLIDSIYHTKLKSVRKARLLSTILPGMGQLYTKNYKSAISSFSINGIFVAYTVFSAVSGLYVTSVLSGLSLEINFFKGGIKNSEILALEYNNRQYKRVKNNILNALDTTYEKNN